MRRTLLSVVGLAIAAGTTLTACTKNTAEEDTDDDLRIEDVAFESDFVFVESDSVMILEFIRKSSTIGAVDFPHFEHVDDFGIECAECHHEVNAGRLNIPHESYFEDFWINCTTCHGNHKDPTGAAMACSKCHHSNPTSVDDQTLSSKVVIHQNCWTCHEVNQGAEASQACSSCHTGPRSPDRPLPTE